MALNEKGLEPSDSQYLFIYVTEHKIKFENVGRYSKFTAGMFIWLNVKKMQVDHVGRVIKSFCLTEEHQILEI